MVDLSWNDLVKREQIGNMNRRSRSTLQEDTIFYDVTWYSLTFYQCPGQFACYKYFNVKDMRRKSYFSQFSQFLFSLYFLVLPSLPLSHVSRRSIRMRTRSTSRGRQPLRTANRMVPCTVYRVPSAHPSTVRWTCRASTTGTTASSTGTPTSAVLLEPSATWMM